MEYAFFNASPTTPRPDCYDDNAAYIYADVFESCQKAIKQTSPEEIISKYSSLSGGVHMTLKPLMLSIDPLHKYIEHIASNGVLSQIIDNSLNSDVYLPANIKQLGAAWKFLEEREHNLPRTERISGEYALTEKEYLSSRKQIHGNRFLSRVLYVMQNIVKNHFANMNTYFYGHRSEAFRFGTDQIALTENIVVAGSISFIEELLPALHASGVDAGLKDLQDQRSLENAFKKGLTESFRLNVFNVMDYGEKRKCPFSSTAVQLWSTVLTQNEAGDYTVSPHFRAGAFPAFIAEQLRAASPSPTCPQTSRDYAPL